jgi:hypothetical protein
MRKSSVLRFLFWLFLILGIIILVSGIALPFFLSSLLNEKLSEVWLRPSDADRWSKNPGEENIKITRSFRIFNYTNLDQIKQGKQPELVQLPEMSFTETAGMYNWEYVDQNGTGFGQNHAQDYLAFNFYTNLSRIQEKTVIADNANVTSFNHFMYIGLYGMTHSPPPVYMVPALYEVVNAMETEFYGMILSYTAWTKYLSNATQTQMYLASQVGEQNVAAVYGDPFYGWQSWKTLKPWVQALLDYNQTGIYNYFETIDIHFQIPGLMGLISSSSLLYGSVVSIQQDMLARYGTNSPMQIGLLQWSTGIVTLNLPLGLGRLNIPGSVVPVPSFLMMNSTFAAPPEIFYFQKVYPNLTATADYSSIAYDLLEVSYVYPRTNYHSLLNINNLATLTNMSQAMATFQFASPLQYQNIQYYLGALINTPIAGTSVIFDGYSLFLSKMTTKSLVSNTVLLRNDAYWTVPTAMVLKEFISENINCAEWVSQVNETLVSICNNPAIGWNISTPTSSLPAFQLWIKAAFKNSTSSSEYLTLSKFIPPTSLNALLFSNAPNISEVTVQALHNTSLLYGCSRFFCTYEELFFKQWSSSQVTLNLSSDLFPILQPSSTMQAWFPLKYSVPVEWFASLESFPNCYFLIIQHFSEPRRHTDVLQQLFKREQHSNS